MLRILLTIIIFQSFVAVKSLTAQITISRSQFGFNQSRDYFTGFTGNGLNDSLIVGVPSPDSAQIFDLRPIYYSNSCQSSWSQDTNISEVMQKFSGATDIQLEIKPWNTPQPADSVLTFYSSKSGITRDTLFYHGEEDLAAISGSIILANPLPLFIFPLKLGSTWADTTLATVGSGSQKVSINGIVDAFGTLLIPTGSFQCLRVTISINYGTYKNYRYYYITPDAYKSASLVALKSANPNLPKQLIFRSSYTDPLAKYDHFVAPALRLFNLSNDTTYAKIGEFDTLFVACENNGDTTAVINSLYLSPASSEFFLPQDYHIGSIAKKDSQIIPVIFHPSKPNFFNTIIFVSTKNKTLGIPLLGKGLLDNKVLYKEKEMEIQVYPQPASTIIYCQLGYNMGSNSSILITDIFGQKVLYADGIVRNRNDISTLFSFNVSELPSGLYFLRSTIGNHIYITRIIICH